MTSNHATTDQPRPVQLTKSLVWPLMVLHLISAIVGVLSMQATGAVAYFEQYLPPQEFERMTPEQLDAMFSAALVVFIGFALVNVALFIVVGRGLRANRPWARFIGLVLAILFLISAGYTLIFATAYGELSGLAFLETMLSWVIVFVTVWWIIQALDKRTGEWFALQRHV